MLQDWDAVVAIGCTLPGVEPGTSYGRPALRFRGKTLASTTAPDPGSFVLHIGIDEKDILLDTDPATFWQTDHYDGWPAVLVRYGSSEQDRIEAVIRRAWWDRASKAQRTEFGPRP